MADWPAFLNHDGAHVSSLCDRHVVDPGAAEHQAEELERQRPSVCLDLHSRIDGGTTSSPADDRHSDLLQRPFARPPSAPPITTPEPAATRMILRLGQSSRVL